MGLQVPEAAISDWSMFDPDARAASSRKHDAVDTGDLRRAEIPVPSSPIVPSSARTRRQGSSYDSQRFTVSQRHSSDSMRPKTGSSDVGPWQRGSLSYDNIRMGVLPSPSTAVFDHKFNALSPPRLSVLNPPSPPPLPPAARVRRSTSPAVTPINSSHLWVTSTFLSRHKDDSSRSGTTSPDSDAALYQNKNDSAAIASEVSRGHDKSKNRSFQSSLQAENGSGRSMVVAMAMKRKQSQPSYKQEEVLDSDEDFALPLQRPSPRNSGAGLGVAYREVPRSIPRSNGYTPW